MNHPLQLIFVDSNPNDVEEMVSSIKTSGIAVRSRIAQDADDLTTLLNEAQPHIILHALENNEVSLEQTVSTINGRAPEIPIIALTKSSEQDPVAYMQQGATTLVNKNNTEHLNLVVNSTAKTQFHIQELKGAAENCNELENRCQRLMESSRDAICYLHEGMHTYANEKYLEKFGYTNSEELYGLSIMDLVAPDDQSAMKDLLKQFSKSKEAGEKNLTFKKEDDETFSAKFSFNPVSVSGEECVQIVIQSASGGGDTKELEEQLSYLSERDVHTGFYHRRSIMDQLDEAANTAKHGKISQAFIQIDIANFNDIKDKFGIAAIDKVSSNVASTLRDCCTENETLSKLTEESFGVLTSNIDTKFLMAFGANVIKNLGELITTSGSDYISIKPAVGAVKIDQFTSDVPDILNKAKNCCDEAWENDANKIVIYKPNDAQMGEQEKDERWTLKLREAVKENRLALLYQPIISLHGEPGERYQIYTALHNKDNELVPASEFVMRIERTGFGKMLDRWIILNALKKLSELRTKGADMRLFIKLSSNSILDKDLPGWLEAQFKTNNISPSFVCFEIKEQVLISNFKESKILVSALQGMKSEIAIDAFGAGDNPSKILKAIPANYVKICHSLMSDVSDNQENQSAIREIAEALKPMGTKVIAQFIEDADTLSILWSLGINYTQGNFLQPPSEYPNYDFSL
ncbi:MAG: EAL domain-containing protein [Gammaproteobacteria bacterium]|nr:MAG: EAL domain-containing protein [Gammaproteobacteria bacterium]